MTARKIIEGDRYRIVKVSKTWNAVEKLRGYDWLGKPRWHCFATAVNAIDRLVTDNHREFYSREVLETFVADIVRGYERQMRAMRERHRQRLADARGGAR